MPIFTYAPKWDALAEFFDKCEEQLPANYTGLIGIRLHRTGMPLSLELFGASLPAKQLFPMVLTEMKKGELVNNWEEIEYKHDVPWVKASDCDAFRNDVMLYYHTEDLLEPEAEKVLAGGSLSAEDLRKVINDHTGALVEA